MKICLSCGKKCEVTPLPIYYDENYESEPSDVELLSDCHYAEFVEYDDEHVEELEYAWKYEEIPLEELDNDDLMILEALGYEV